MTNANHDANPELMRLALKLATGAGKTTVMAMLIAWQTVNAVRHPQSKRFTRGFLVVTPGITIKDRLRVLQPNDPDSYYQSRELVPNDMLGEIGRAKIVITNYHAFKRRERVELSKGGRSLLQGRGPELDTLETEGQMLQRVMPDLMGLADTFTESLARLSGEEQKGVKTTAFDLQMNPAAPGMQLHKLDKAKDRNFWSVRVSRDIRLIVHRTADSLLLAYVGHHDAAYQWAERRRLETHPKTGAAQ
jgi:hypothetical protein